MKPSVSFLFLVLLVAAGCEKSININLPDLPGKLVLNAVITSGTNIHVHLTRTLSNKETGRGIDASVADAHAILYRDGQVVDTLVYDKEGIYLSKTTAVPGHHYKMMITHPSYPSVETETESPISVPVESWEREPNAGTNPNNGIQDLLRIRIKDPSETGNHYILQVLSGSDVQGVDNDFYSWGNCINTSDPSFETPYSDFPGEDACMPSRSLFLKDVLFNGQQKELRLFASSYSLMPYTDMTGTDTVYAEMRVHHVTPQFYQFVKSYRGSQDASDNPFAEPYNLLSNVKGGYGIFTIINSQGFEVR